jgi:hypothetical protein
LVMLIFFFSNWWERNANFYQYFCLMNFL